MVKYNKARVKGFSIRKEPKRTTDKKQNRQIKKLWRAVKGETKVHLFNPIAFGIVGYAGETRRLIDVPEGDGQGERTGTSIFAKHIRVRAFTQWNPLNTAQRDTYRLIVYKCRNPPAGDPLTEGDVLQTVSAASTVISPKSIDGYTKSKILYDRTFHIGNPDISDGFDSNVPSTRLHDIKLPLNCQVVYDKDSSSGVKIVKNGIYMLLTCSSGSNGPDIELYSTFTYSDN